MLSVLSHRPSILYLALFVVAYVLAAGFAQLLAIVPGTGISIWPPSGLFIATLVLAPARSWPWWVLAGFAAEFSANVLWFHNPLPVAVLIYSGNALEGMVGAWLVNRTCGRPVRMETVQEVLALIVLGAGVAPLVSATVGSATLASFGMQSFTTAWPLWWIGDATGVLIVAPLALVVFQSWSGSTKLSPARWTEAAVLGLIFLGVAGLSLSGVYLPFAYIIMPPLLWAAVRFEFKGAVIALALLALITAAFTISGVSQFAGDPESQKQKHVMLQLFLVISAFSALIVAAISRQHQLALVTLRESVEALRVREKELSQLVEMVPVHIRRLTPEGNPIFFNKRLLDFFGLKGVSELDRPGMSRLAAAIGTLVHPDDAPILLGTVHNALATGEPFSLKYRMLRADGAYRWVDGRGEAVEDESGTIVQWYAISIDIDDEMRAQEALRDRERELSQLVDMVPSLLWRLSPAGEPVFFSKRMVEFLGLNVGSYERPGMSGLAAAIAAIVHPDDVSRLTDALNRCFVSGESFSMRYRVRRADGIYRWMDGRAEPLRDENGHILQWYGLLHDVDDQVHAEETLRRSEQHLQQIIDAVPANIWSWTPAGAMSYISKRYQALLDLPAANSDDFVRAAQKLVHPDDAAEVQGTVANCLKTGDDFAIRYRRRGKDGSYRWMEARCEPLRDEDGAIVQWYGVSVDIDDQVRSREELSLAQEKLALASQAASLAELSASIAHEVNQPLAAVVANSLACQRWLAAEPPNMERAQKTLEHIVREANSAADVVSHIRALFRRAVAARTSTMPSSVIVEARNLMAEEAERRRVRMTIEVESDLPLVALDRVQIQQVLINLLRNGMDAMDDAAADDRTIGIRARRTGDVVQVEVSDRGAGVASPDKIFEPFFTTKEHGMGMGLAVCRSIVESHGGRLWAEPNKPQGATFIFTLPTEAKAAP